MFVARRIGIKEAYTAHTLTVCSFLRTQCWDKIMSCVLWRNPPPPPPQGEEEPSAHRSFVGFCPVKKMAPSPREAIGPEVPDESPFSAPSPRGAMLQKSPMHAYSQVSVVSANVPRLRICSSLFVVRHSTCDPEVNAECARMRLCSSYCKKYTFQKHKRGF